MEKLGLVIDAFQIQEIKDATGYIENLAAPHAAAVARDVCIAAAEADQAATEKEQEANARRRASGASPRSSRPATGPRSKGASAAPGRSARSGQGEPTGDRGADQACRPTGAET